MSFASLSLKPRARHQETCTGHRRIWTSVCGQYRISEFRRLGGRLVYYAERREVTATGQCWEIVSRHRNRQQAINGLLRYLLKRRKPR